MREYTILVGSYAPAQAQGIHLFRLRADPLRLEPAGGQSGPSKARGAGAKPAPRSR